MRHQLKTNLVEAEDHHVMVVGIVMEGIAMEVIATVTATVEALGEDMDDQGMNNDL